MKEYTPCESCKVSKTPGYHIDPDNNMIECDCRKRYENYRKLYTYLTSSGVPQKYIDYNIDEYLGDKSSEMLHTIKSMLPNIVSFVNKGYQLYFSGKFNTQKTSVACYIIKKAAIKGIKVHYISMPQLVNCIKKNEFSKDEDERGNAYTKLLFVRDADLLILDDAFDEHNIYIGKKGSYYMVILEDLFRDRYNKVKSQIFISANKRHDISSKFGDSLRLLLNRDCLELEFKDVVPQDKLRSEVLEFIQQGV